MQQARGLPVIRKTPADYTVDIERATLVRSPPVFSLRRPSYYGDDRDSAEAPNSPGLSLRRQTRKGHTAGYTSA